jgi:uncharacterized protein
MSRLEVQNGTDAADPFFRVQRCRACGGAQHYERPLCVRCGSGDLEPIAPSGRGTIYSFTVIHRSLLPRWSAPYVLALVRLEEGPVVMSHIVGADTDTLTCDIPVQAQWVTSDDGDRLAVFRPLGTLHG